MERFGFDLIQNNLVLSWFASFGFFLGRVSAMQDFRVSLRLGMIILRVFRVKQSIWKGFKSMEPKFESFGLWLENWIWKVKKRR